MSGVVAPTDTNTTTKSVSLAVNKNAALAARIKRMMQSDEEVGKIVKTTPLVMAKALELFLTKLFKATADMALAHGARIIGPVHLKGAISDNDEFDFLEDVVKDVPDLPPPPDPAELAAKLLERVDEDGNPKKKKKKKKTTTTTNNNNSNEKKKAGAAGKKANAKKRKNADYDSEDDEEFDEDEEDTDAEEYESEDSEEEEEEKPVITTTSRSGRTITARSYAEGDAKKKKKKSPATKKAKKSPSPQKKEQEQEEEEEAAGDLAAGNLGSFDDDDLVGVAVPAEEDDYDEE